MGIKIVLKTYSNIEFRTGISLLGALITETTYGSLVDTYKPKFMTLSSLDSTKMVPVDKRVIVKGKEETEVINNKLVKHIAL